LVSGYVAGCYVANLIKNAAPGYGHGSPIPQSLSLELWENRAVLKKEAKLFALPPMLASVPDE